MILSGDIGGSNSRLALFDDQLNLIAGPTVVPTRADDSLETAARKLIGDRAASDLRACFAVAGPVIGGRAKMTNVQRTFDEIELGRALGFGRVKLINDLVANVAGIDALEADKLVTLLPGVEEAGNRAVVSPGTGLGEAGAIWERGQHWPIASEGGHSGFAPTTPREADLWRFLVQRFETVTWERVLSGPGVVNLFDFCRQESGSQPSQKLLDELAGLPEKDKPTAISQAAARNDCPAAKAALELFARLLANEAANLSLKLLAIGGVYLGGGIPPKILPFLQTQAFKNAFLTHQTMGKLLARVPVRVILDDHTALEGAALYGLRFAT